MLAIALYWLLSREDESAKKESAERIAAATAAARTTSHPVSPGAQFSAREALRGLYGNYDPIVDGAYWTVTGAPRAWAEWNGKTVAIKPLISRSDESATRHIVVTNSVDVKNGIVVKQGAGCRNCKSLLGAALFERRGNEWQLVSEHRFLAVEGVWGAPPKVAVAFRPSGEVELRIETPNAGQPDIKEAGSIIVFNGGKITRSVVAQSTPDPAPSARARPAEPRPRKAVQNPFPSAAEGP